MPAPSPVSGSQPQAPRCSRFSSTARPLLRRRRATARRGCSRRSRRRTRRARRPGRRAPASRRPRLVHRCRSSPARPSHSPGPRARIRGPLRPRRGAVPARRARAAAMRVALDVRGEHDHRLGARHAVDLAQRVDHALEPSRVVGLDLQHQRVARRSRGGTRAPRRCARRPARRRRARAGSSPRRR